MLGEIGLLHRQAAQFRCRRRLHRRRLPLPDPSTASSTVSLTPTAAPAPSTTVSQATTAARVWERSSAWPVSLLPRRAARVRRVAAPAPSSPSSPTSTPLAVSPPLISQPSIPGAPIVRGQSALITVSRFSSGECGRMAGCRVGNGTVGRLLV